MNCPMLALNKPFVRMLVVTNNSAVLISEIVGVRRRETAFDFRPLRFAMGWQTSKALIKLGVNSFHPQERVASIDSCPCPALFLPF